MDLPAKRKLSQNTLELEPVLKKAKISPEHEHAVMADAEDMSDSSAPVTPKLGPSKPAAKKLVIKPFKVKPTIPENYEEETWGRLQAAVHAIHTSQPVSTSLEELYKMCENMCVYKMSAKLYISLERECAKHVQGELSRLVNQTADPVAFLNLVDRVWSEHCQHMLLIRQIFLVLDRTYVMQTANVKSLWDMGLLLYRQHVASNVEISRKTVAGLLELIGAERRGESVNRALLMNLLRMFDALTIYSDIFEVPFLEATKKFYAVEGDEKIQVVDVATYLEHVDHRLQEENDRVLHYLDPSTRKPLIQTVEKYLLDKHIDALLQRGFDDLVDNTRKADLQRMYLLFHRVNAAPQLRAAFLDYIKKRGCEIVQDPNKDETMVQDLLDFKARLTLILEEAFQNKEAFRHALKEGFEYFINTRQNRPAEMIAKFIDAKLKSTGHKGASDEELTHVLDMVMILFRFINGKDVFEAFYKKDLAKRLLLQRSASFDAEKSMIEKLKKECGASFTNKLEGMFKDVELSSDIMLSFKQTVRASRKVAEVDMAVNVLTMGYWPTYPPAEINLPVQLAEYQTIFKDFYLSKHNGRRLTFQNSLGQCVLKATFPKEQHDLDVSLFQTVILLLFNQQDQITFEDIKTSTNIEDKELRRTLQSLACGKINTRVLTKKPKGKDVEDGDVFEYNKEFSNNLFRVKINQIQMKETAEENQQTNERVFQDRQYQIDAAIVRIMKTRKQLTHTLLVNECYNQLKFPMKPADLKKRIESLIDREYLERDAKDATLYNYLA